MRVSYAQLVKASLCVLLLFIALLPFRKVSYAQNSVSSSKEIIVVFKNRPTVATFAAFSNSTTQDLEIKNSIYGSNAIVFSVVSGDVKTAMAEIVKNPDIVSVFPNHRLNLLSVPNDPSAASTQTGGLPRQQWNLYAIKAADTGNSAWDITQGSANVVVAVIDTGVNSTHEDLVGKIDSMVDCSTGSCTPVTTMTDNHAAGHGTHVAGLVGAATNNSKGIASVGYNTKLMILRVLSTSGEASTDNFFNAIRWAADHGAKVINTSFGVVADSLSQVAITEYDKTINYAWSKGVVVVAAAGNCKGNTNGRAGCEIRREDGTVTGYAENVKMYPAASPNVISVAASTVGNTLASYSEQNDASKPTVGDWITLAAPGGDGACTDSTKTCILSTVPTNQYFWQSGTSMASPQVAGVAALVLAAKPGLTNQQVVDIITSSADHSVAVPATKYGLVNALAAVQQASAVTQTSPTPTPPGSSPSVTPNPNLSPTVNLTPTSAAIPTIIPSIGPTLVPTIPPYPTTPPKLPRIFPTPMPAGPYCPAITSCPKKVLGDANCDGTVNEADLNLWKQEFDTMPPAASVNQNANFVCTEGDSSTYFVDLIDYEIWRKNTTGFGTLTPTPSGILTVTPSPTGSVSTPTPTSVPISCRESTTFSDIPSTNQYYNAVTCLTGKPYCTITGDLDGKFSPDRTITRAEVVTFITRYHVNVVKDWTLVTPPATPSFSDVSAAHWAYTSIETAKAKGFIAGYPDGTFKPDNTWVYGFCDITKPCSTEKGVMTRGQFIKALYDFGKSQNQLSSCQ